MSSRSCCPRTTGSIRARGAPSLISTRPGGSRNSRKTVRGPAGFSAVRNAAGAPTPRLTTNRPLARRSEEAERHRGINLAVPTS